MEMKSKQERILWKCYVELYKHSTPSVDFNWLVETAPINEFGQKEIDFMSYEIDPKKFDEIVDSILTEHKVNKMKKKMFKTTILLGCSPKYSSNIVNSITTEIKK